MNFCPCYNIVVTEGHKCIKFESKLRSEIKQGIEYQEIRQFFVLVNRCRIYDEDRRSQSAHYKSLSENKGKAKNSGKPYGNSSNKGKHKADQKEAGGKEKSGGRTLVSVRCFKCGEFGHRIFECKSTIVNCFKCGKPSHGVVECKSNSLTCYNYGEHGHISTQCEKPKKAHSRGKVFALSGAETTTFDNLIRVIFFINNIPLISIIITVVT
ncbi:uncharacterized protein LOC127079213 [Lathyrus oleraceus]|uniref:uncharacterized protein LOC127079213 n=1 Tax=Pisum sativum TaxID=3888 RepID=UPI0021CFB6C7|nr:uncharacterized protein LOC127079213 [Pisum sativum]